MGPQPDLARAQNWRGCGAVKAFVREEDVRQRAIQLKQEAAVSPNPLHPAPTTLPQPPCPYQILPAPYPPCPTCHALHSRAP
ncbi:hypothetical protein HaLaN_14750 [Haematococcus lacustris]|uniref:Uncharacterized protein n=1 Tax=Haematococcus lacustris TaxID=44745 RepID=A0A699ZG06_HAELA|nr:hypothetical protein HaLaN_14750 [Haematococcus lacustris]